MSACGFQLSGEPRMINSSYFGAVTPVQIFWKNAKIVNGGFSVMSHRRIVSLFVGLIMCSAVIPLEQLYLNLSKLFCNHHYNFHRRGTIFLFSTPSCQSDPEWIPKTKLETPDLRSGPFTRILNHRKKLSRLYA